VDADLLNYAGKQDRLACETRLEIARFGMAVVMRAGSAPRRAARDASSRSDLVPFLPERL